MTSSIGLAQPEQYQYQLDEKVALTRREFSALLPSSGIEVYRSPESHFRMRAEFRIWHDKGTAHFAMYEPGKYKQPVIIEEFSIGSTAICSVMPKLLAEINSVAILRERLFQVEFLSTLSGDLLITLIYHKPLNNEWEAEAKKLEHKLDAHIIGRSRKQKCTLSKDSVTERFDLWVGEISYQQIETGFTQPNASMCIDMLNWSVKNSLTFGGDLLELYCGNGNFTIPLSFNFDKVLATEISKLSTRAALNNIKTNKRNNIELARLSAEEVSEALAKTRAFRRLSHLNLDDYAFTTVFVDPPRAGLDPDTLNLVSTFENIIYISCNPDTLKSNLDVLTATHRISKFALFDQFPYTHHRECGVILNRL